MFLCREILVWVLGHKIMFSLDSYFQALTLAFVFDTFIILITSSLTIINELNCFVTTLQWIISMDVKTAKGWNSVFPIPNLSLYSPPPASPPPFVFCLYNSHANNHNHRLKLPFVLFLYLSPSCCCTDIKQWC